MDALRAWAWWALVKLYHDEAMTTKPLASTVQEVITLTDLTTQILTNAQVLFPREQDLKIVSAQAPSGLLHWTTLMAIDTKSASTYKEWKLVLQGPGERDRRSSMMKLLEETERRVAKQLLRK